MATEHAYAAIVLGIACGYPVKPDDVAEVIAGLGPEESARLCRALATIGALDRHDQAVLLLTDASEPCDHCGGEFVHEDGCPEAEVAGQPVGAAA